jgi:general secretion pathway protein K
MHPMKNRMNRVLKSDKGVALFLVLWVLTLLSVIVGEFCYAMRTEINITRNFKEETEGYYIAYAGLNIAIKKIIENKLSLKEAESPAGEQDQEGEFEWRLNVNMSPVPFANGSFIVRIDNESGKVNLNMTDERLLKMILDGFELDASEKDTIVDSILDWRDKNNLHRINGAEDDYYLALPDPYECKDGNFDSIEEVLLVKGMTPEIFYGGLKDLITVYPHDNSQSSSVGNRGKISGDANKININAASARMLQALPGMTDDMVNELIEYREKQDVTSLTEILSIVGPDVYDSIASYLTHKMNSYYCIESIGMLEGSKVKSGFRAVINIDASADLGFNMVEWVDSPVLSQENQSET